MTKTTTKLTKMVSCFVEIVLADSKQSWHQARTNVTLGTWLALVWKFFSSWCSPDNNINGNVAATCMRFLSNEIR